MKTTIIFYKDWLPLIKSLPADLRAEFWDLWSNYDDINYNPVIENEHLKGVFDFIISQVKKADSKYECYKQKQSVNGRKGGRPKTQKTQAFSQKPTETQKSLNVDVNVKDNEKEKIKGEIILFLSGNGRTPEEVEKVASEQVSEFEKDFHSTTTWIKTNAPRVAQMKEPFTFQQFVYLRHKIPDKQKLKDLLLNMHNWKDLQKNVSAYLTILKWAKK